MWLLKEKFDSLFRFFRRLFFAPIDIVYAFFLFVFFIVWMLTRKKCLLASSNSLLFLDTSYSLKQIYDRELEYALSARDCDGLFDRVWSIHPLAGADENVDIDESMTVTSVSDTHKFVEVSVSNASKKNCFICTNFLKAQIDFFKYVYGLISKGEVRAVRVGDPIYLGLVGVWVSYIAGCPFIIRINGNYDLLYETTKLPAFPRLIRSIFLEKKIIDWVLPKADLVITPSDDNRDYVLDKGVDPEKVKVVGYGSLLNPLHYEDPALRKGVRDELGVGDRPLVASVTRLEPSKKVEQILQALFHIAEIKPEIVCVIAGDGSLKTDLVEKAEEKGLRSNLILVGNKPQTWLASLLADSDVLVFPLAGRALVEAALSGTPIVACDTEWHHELIDANKSGVLVEVDNPKIMAKSVIDLLDDKEKAMYLAENLRKKVISDFATKDLIRLERGFVSDLLDRSKIIENG